MPELDVSFSSSNVYVRTSMYVYVCVCVCVRRPGGVVVKISNFQPDGWEFYTIRGREKNEENVEKECGEFSA